ncbi:hypothetical protein [Solirubrum puertoriconensis]|nr:hypothetical protein [Solirubrum puertoriconensis]
MKGAKGLQVINSMSKTELKEKRREYIEFTRTMIGRGFTYTQMVDAIRQKYGVAVRQAKNYVKETKDQIRKELGEEQEKDRADVVTKLWQLYRDLYASNQLKEAAKVLDQYIKLKGMEAPKTMAIMQKTEVTHDYSHLSPEEILELTTKLSNPNK